MTQKSESHTSYASTTAVSNTREISTEVSHVAADLPPAEPNWKLVTLGGVVFFIALAAAIIYGVHHRAATESQLEKTTDAAAVPSVNVVHPSTGSAAQDLVLPGNTQAFVDTPIYARTSGYLKKWYVDIGQQVKQGQLLATIETPELDQQLQQAEAELKSAQANLSLAKTTSDRWQAMLAKHAVSQQETDQAMGAELTRQAAVDSAEANVRRLQQLQAYERVTAPFDGTITTRNTDIGALIDSGSAAGSANARELFHMTSKGKLRVFVAVPEVYAEHISDGMKVSITRDSNPKDVITGTVTRNANEIDHASRTLNVEVDLDNAKGELLPGAYVFVHFKLAGGANTFTIPSNTLLFRAEGLRVGVVENNKVELKAVTIGHDFGNAVEVTSGLTEKDAIVLDPSDSLASGQQVQAKLVTPKAVAQ